MLVLLACMYALLRARYDNALWSATGKRWVKALWYTEEARRSSCQQRHSKERCVSSAVTDGSLSLSAGSTRLLWWGVDVVPAACYVVEG